MVRGKRSVGSAEPRTRAPRARKAKLTNRLEDQEESGNTDEDAEIAPAQAPAPRRSGRARTVSQPPASLLPKKTASRAARAPAESAIESAEEDDESPKASHGAKRRRDSDDSVSDASYESRFPSPIKPSELVSPKSAKRRRLEQPASDPTSSSANAERAPSPSLTPAEPRSSANLHDIETSTSPSATRMTSSKRRRAEASPHQEDVEEQELSSLKAAKRQRVQGLADGISSTDAEEQVQVSLNLTADNVHNGILKSDEPVEVPIDTSSTTPASPPPYPVPNPDATSEGEQPGWKEPPLGLSIEAQLTKSKLYPFFRKKEFNMQNDQGDTYDELQDKRDVFKKRVAPIRGRGRGRGRGGRGRGGRPPANGDHPEPSEVPIPSATTRGRGGYRVKKSENPFIQALYHRRAALRNQYKAIGNVQRAALEALGEKSLEVLKSDYQAHAQLPAFDQTVQKLGEIFVETVGKADAKLLYEREFYAHDKAQKEEYERQLQYFEAQDQDDEMLVEFLQNIHHISKQIAAEATADEVPFYPSDGGFNPVYISKPPKVVAVEGTPYGVPGDWPATAGVHVGTAGDTEYEQHPANFVRSIHPEDRKKFHQDLLVKKGLISAATERKKPAQPKSKSLLAPTVEVSANTMAPTPGDGSEAEQGGQDDDDESSSDGEVGTADTVDEYGLKLVNKPVPKKGIAPNNRFVVGPHFQFEDYEIGIRAARNKRTNTGEAQYIGKDANPNPKAFYLDQRATGQWNTATFKPGNLDEDLVAIFKVHPIYGLPIPGAANPTHEDLEPHQKHILKPRSDWTKPLEPTQPKVFIEQDTSGGIANDRDQKVYHTSRSVRFIRSQQLFDEDPSKRRITGVLKEIFDEYRGIKLHTVFQEPVVEPTTPLTSKGKEKEAPQSLMPDLLDAVNQAKKLLTEEEVKEARMKFLKSAVRRYDPVRDEYTSSAYSAPPAVPAPIPQLHEDRTYLNLLAHLAENSRFTRPAPPIYQPTFVPPPPPLWTAANHPPMIQGHPHGHPQRSPQQMQQPRPQANTFLRQLLPAPPQGPPPSPSSNQYRY